MAREAEGGPLRGRRLVLIRRYLRFLNRPKGMLDRQSATNLAPPSGEVADLDRASVGFGDGADDRQAEAASAGRARGVGRALAADEAPEDLVAHRGRDPRAVI